jgi:hypothetical protein
MMARKVEILGSELTAAEATALRATGADPGNVLTADGAGGSAWSAPPAGGGGGGAGQYASVTALAHGASLTSAHSGGLVIVDSATEATITLTDDTTGGWTTGAVVDLMSLGAGRVIVQQGGGVTINGAAATASPILYRAHHRVTLIRTGANAWSAVGASTLMALGYNGVVQALYPLDGNLDDYTGGSAMTPVGTTSWEADSVVPGGQCLTGTTGVQGYCTFTAPANTITGTADWTIEGWFKAAQTSTEGRPLRDAASQSNLFLQKLASTNALTLTLGAAGVAVITNANVGVVTPGEWFHCAIVREAGVVRVYLNGGLTYENTGVTGSAITVGATLWLGGNTSTTGLAECRTDQLRISNVALYSANFVPAQQLVAL